MKNSSVIKSLKIAATFLGTIIGAGFATGQEIVKFFTYFGFHGYIGIGIATLIIIIIGTIILNIAFSLNSNSYHEFLYQTFGNSIGLFGDILITVFLFGIFNVMLSAAGALFNQYFGLPYYFGITITLITVVVVALKGIKSVLNINFIVVPFIIVIILAIGFYSMFNYSNSSLVRNLYNSSENWLMSAIMFASYNIILSIPILVPLAKNSNSRQEFKLGMLIAGIIVGILILFINTVLLNNFDENITFQIPLLHVVEPFGNFAKLLFVIVLWLAIYTTILNNMFGLTFRLCNIFKTKESRVVIIVSILSIFISGFDFKTLLSILYPIFGYVSFGFIIIILVRQFYQKIKERIIYISKKILIIITE